jgi:hypothetical protein
MTIGTWVFLPLKRHSGGNVQSEPTRNFPTSAIFGRLRVFRPLMQRATIRALRVGPHAARFGKSRPVVRLR